MAAALLVPLATPAGAAAQTPTPVPAEAALPAFPGAVGWAAQTPGGRGGRIIRVTNLNGEGPGSL
ncbi:MAG: pectate lyase, partial [Brevundimonas sp.]